MRTHWSILRTLALFSLLWVHVSAQAQVPAMHMTEAGVQPIGYLPPTQEGTVRILLRMLTSVKQDGVPLSEPPTVRVYHGTEQIACHDDSCAETGVMAVTRPTDALTPLHLGIIVDDTLRLSSRRSLSDDICAALRAADLPDTIYSFWRIRDSAGEKRLGEPTTDIEEACQQLSTLEGRARDVRSPIFDIIDSSLRDMASNTTTGIRRELYVISDGEDETCVGSSDEDECSRGFLKTIQSRSVENAIPVSTLLVDSSQSAARVALHQGQQFKSISSETGGTTRSIYNTSSADDFRALMQNQLRAIHSAAFVSVKCLDLPPEASTVQLLVSNVGTTDYGERVFSAASRTLASAPILCAAQHQICQGAAQICQPKALSPDPSGDSPNALSEDTDTQDSGSIASSGKKSLRYLLFILALLLFLFALLLFLRRRRKQTAEETSTDDALPSAALDDAPSADQAPADATIIDSSIPAMSSTASSMPVAVSPLAQLRLHPSFENGPHLVALTRHQELSSVPLHPNEWTRVETTTEHGLRVSEDVHAAILLRYQTSNHTIEVMAGDQAEGTIYVNRRPIGQSIVQCHIGDVLHFGDTSRPMELRLGSDGGAATATLHPVSSQQLQLMDVRIDTNECVIGRDPAPTAGWESEFTTSIRLPLERLGDQQRLRVSSDHVVLWISNGYLLVRDISSNGVLLNGQRLQPYAPTPARSGDTISISREVSYRVKITS